MGDHANQAQKIHLGFQFHETPVISDFSYPMMKLSSNHLHFNQSYYHNPIAIRYYPYLDYSRICSSLFMRYVGCFELNLPGIPGYYRILGKVRSPICHGSRRR